jgi:hypothetical protein
MIPSKRKAKKELLVGLPFETLSDIGRIRYRRPADLISQRKVPAVFETLVDIRR